jgi:hypothetical protein
MKIKKRERQLALSFFNLSGCPSTRHALSRYSWAAKDFGAR